jgi:hypothetical protein
MDEAKAEVIRVDESTVFVPGVGSQQVRRVVFRVGDHGPFTLDYKLADFTPARVRADMEATAATIRALY